MVQDQGRETIGVFSPPPEGLERRVRAILPAAADYLALRITSAWKPELPEDCQMRMSGAVLQQRLTEFVLTNYESRGPGGEKECCLSIRKALSVFWREYRSLVLQPLEKRGFDLRTIPAGTGMAMVFSLQDGVRGMVAAAIMARDLGWEVKFPAPEEDVRKGNDLIVGLGEKKVALQIKCRKEGKFVVKRISPSLILVIIPNEKGFFLDHSVGIPHSSKKDLFKRWLLSQIEGGQ